MTKFKCKISDLNTICKMASMSGTNVISGKEYDAMEDMLLTVGDNIEILAISALKELMVKINYKVEVIEKGEIAISDIRTFEKFLGRFSPNDDVTVSVADNKVVITRETPRKVARMPIGDSSTIQSTNGVKNIGRFSKVGEAWTNGKDDYGLAITFNIEKLQEVIEDGDVVKQRVYPFVIKNDEFSISIGSEESGVIETTIPTKQIANAKDTRTAYASGIDNLVNAINGEVTLYMVAGGSHPFILEKHTQDYDFVGLLAPRIED